MLDLGNAVETVAQLHLAEFPPHVARLPAPQRLGWLDSAEAVKMHSRRTRRRLKRALVQFVGGNVDPGKAQEEAERQINIARAVSASADWTRVNVAALDASGVRSTTRSVIVDAIKGAGLHPIRGEVTFSDGMGKRTELRWLHRQCVRCGHLMGKVYSNGSSREEYACGDCVTENTAILAHRMGHKNGGE